jgi:hypothetical protein
LKRYITERSQHVGNVPYKRHVNVDSVHELPGLNELVSCNRYQSRAAARRREDQRRLGILHRLCVQPIQREGGQVRRFPDIERSDFPVESQGFRTARGLANSSPSAAGNESHCRRAARENKASQPRLVQQVHPVIARDGIRSQPYGDICLQESREIRHAMSELRVRRRTMRHAATVLRDAANVVAIGTDAVNQRAAWPSARPFVRAARSST